MRAHRVRARFRDRRITAESRPCLIACAYDVHSTFKDLIVAERARPCSSEFEGELLTALSRRGQGGSFRCKTVSTASFRKGDHDEENSFYGHSFLSANRGASSAEPPFFWSLGIRGKNQGKEPASKIDQHRRRSTSGRCWAAADRSPAADIVLELRSSYS